MLGGWKCDASGPGTGQGPLCQHLLPFLRFPAISLSPIAVVPLVVSLFSAPFHQISLFVLFHGMASCFPPPPSILSFLLCIFPCFVRHGATSYCNLSNFVCVKAHCCPPLLFCSASLLKIIFDSSFELYHRSTAEL